MPDGHQNKIRAVSEQVLARSKITILKTTPSHSIRDPGDKANCHSVDVSPLNEVLVSTQNAALRPPRAR